MIEPKIEGKIPGIAFAGRETMQECSRIMLDGVERTFHEGGWPGPWRALKSGKPATLFRTGTLYHSLNTDFGYDFAEVSTPVHYARYLHHGTRKMWARPFMIWRDDMKDAVLEILADSVRFTQEQPYEYTQ